jgi:hypothetical protein
MMDISIPKLFGNYAKHNCLYGAKSQQNLMDMCNSWVVVIGAVKLIDCEL